ncbi:ring-cleaving dioxygenase [Cohnella hashimotonis]|uniref:Ring-cleaving dioxygenase n=1 Tax=Cohnella hashimotonis TaxID=2826895 RepID=A0ABT6TPC4_9BACL|nr:ring-cleaving dioxygenase [Cohnella hashimotonis]MDI4648703.1 ring-cleaving dioxygenase [Cohnella hashimotonis]
MTQKTAGIHHITAFVRNAQDNVDFYAGVLGLRLVKKTVNFDGPEVYHLYFGNEGGSPGTAITFFPFEHGRKGMIGGGQVGWSTFAVPVGALSFWEGRLAKLGIAYERTTRFGETFLRFRDRDELQLELVERVQGEPSKWSFGGVPADKAIKGLGGAVLFSLAPDKTMETLQGLLGLEKVGSEGGLVRFRAYGELGNIVEVREDAVPGGHGGSGTVHHIAWRAKNDEDHRVWRERTLVHGFQPTPFTDRQYFNAIYFRETGGILFEIATDPPGFARDEPAEALGELLMLPEWFEPRRAELEKALPPIEVRVLDADRAQ